MYGQRCKVLSPQVAATQAGLITREYTSGKTVPLGIPCRMEDPPQGHPMPPEAKEERDIGALEKSLFFLDSELTALETRFSQLHARLLPVLRPVDGEEGSAEGKPADPCSLAALAVQAAADRVTWVTCQLEGLMGRLEV